MQKITIFKAIKKLNGSQTIILKKKDAAGQWYIFLFVSSKKDVGFFLLFQLGANHIKIPKKRRFKANINLAMNVLILNLLAQTK